MPEVLEPLELFRRGHDGCQRAIVIVDNSTPGALDPAGASRTRSHSCGVHSPFELRGAVDIDEGEFWRFVWDREREFEFSFCTSRGLTADT